MYQRPRWPCFSFAGVRTRERVHVIECDCAVRARSSSSSNHTQTERMCVLFRTKPFTPLNARLGEVVVGAAAAAVASSSSCVNKHTFPCRPMHRKNHGTHTNCGLIGWKCVKIVMNTRLICIARLHFTHVAHEHSCRNDDSIETDLAGFWPHAPTAIDR